MAARTSTRRESARQAVKQRKVGLRENERKKIQTRSTKADNGVNTVTTEKLNVQQETGDGVETKAVDSVDREDLPSKKRTPNKRTPANSNKTQSMKHGPFVSIPSEILGLIFQHYVKMERSVWDLIPVSKRWECIAFSTPTLWSSILVVNYSFGQYSMGKLYHNNEAEYYDRIVNSKHVCFERHHLKKAMSRAGACPLDIEIRFGLVSPEEVSLLEFALDMFMEPNISERIESLELGIGSPAFAVEFPDYFCDISLPNLSRLLITRMPPHWCSNLLDSVSDSTNRLDIVRGLACALDEGLSDHLCSGVRRLELEDSYGSAVEEVDQVIHKFVNVEVIAGLPSGWPSIYTNAGTLQHLNRARILSEPSHMRRMRWPSLELLEFHDHDEHQEADSGDSKLSLEQISFPNLTSLDLHTYRPLYCLSNITAPRLTELWVSLQYDPEISPSTSMFLSVNNLYISTKGPDEMTVSLLKSLPNVSLVTLVPASRDPYLGLNLLKSLMDPKDGPNIAPNLQHFKLGREDGPIGTAREEPLIKQFVRMRKRLDFPFGMEVHWAYKVCVHYGSSRKL